MQEIFQLFGQYGFPVVVATYFMVKGSQDTKSLTCAVNNLTTMIQRLLDKENIK